MRAPQKLRRRVRATKQQHDQPHNNDNQEQAFAFDVI
jgi:hypothetical protein